MSKIYDALKRAERERETTRDPFPERDALRSAGRGAVEDGGDEDEYQRLRVSLAFTPAYSEVRTILVTAARHGEGTTRVAIGLAKALAEGDTRVLVVEANLRSPSLRERLPVANGPGLGDLLNGQVGVESLVTYVGDWNLSVVTAGARRATVDCAALTGGIARLAPQFDFVVIDSPPVNQYADARALAAKADGVILVVEADSTPVIDAENAKRSLDRVGARIFGVVLNRRRSYIPATLQALL